MKQETLEEAAENYSDIHGERYEVKGQLHFVNTFSDIENAFEAGAKWQQEQDKKMYSEEDMKRAYCDGNILDYDIMISTIEGNQILQQWFEQFKR